MRNPTESMNLTSAVMSIASARSSLGFLRDEQLKLTAKPIAERLEADSSRGRETVPIANRGGAMSATPKPFAEIGIEASEAAGRLQQDHNVPDRRALAPIYVSLGELAKAIEAHTGNVNACLRDLKARVERLEHESIPKPTAAAKSLWRRFIEKVKSDVSFIS